jgi:two-component system NarL family sensor kinase
MKLSLHISNLTYELNFFLILISLVPFYSTSQNQMVIDSLLLKVSQKVDDTVKVKAYNDLSWEYQKIDANRARNYARKAISISKELGYERGELEGLNRLGTVALYQEDYNLGIELYKEILKREKEIAYQYGIGRAQNQLSDLYYRKGNLQQALIYGKESLDVFKNINLSNKDALVATALSVLGSIYIEKGDFEEAIQNLLGSLKIRKRLGDDNGKAITLSKLGELNIKIKEYLKAKEYLIESLAIFLELEKKEYELAKIYDNLGIVTFYLGDYPNAKIYYDKSLRLKAKFDLKDDDWIVFNNMATLYYALNDLESALYYGRRAEKILKKKHIADQAEVSLNLGNIYHQKKKYKQAINYYENALKISENSKNDIVRFKILNNLLSVYQEVGKLKDAIIVSKKVIALSESINKKERNAIRQLREYEKEVTLLDKNNKIKDANLKRVLAENEFKSLLNYGFGIGLVLLSLLFFAFFQSRKLQQKNKLATERTKLAEQKALVALQNQELEEQKVKSLLDEQELRFNQALLEGQEKERTRIAKDLHDRLGSMLSMVKIHYKTVEDQLEKLKSSNKAQYEKVNTLLDEACEEVRRIANDINSGTLAKFGLVAALEDLTLSLNQSKYIHVELNTHGISKPLNKDVEIEIYRIIQELMHNILKHAFAKEVSIQLLQNKKGLNIIVEDDGIGFEYNSENLKGMGLKNVISRVEIMDGELQIDSTPNKGTTVMVDIPIKEK